jgi:hypothetical protein
VVAAKAGDNEIFNQGRRATGRPLDDFIRGISQCSKDRPNKLRTAAADDHRSPPPRRLLVVPQRFDLRTELYNPVIVVRIEA